MSLAQEEHDDDPRWQHYWRKYEWPLSEDMGLTTKQRKWWRRTKEVPREDASKADKTKQPNFYHMSKEFRDLPADKWDTDDPAFHDKVTCDALIKVTAVDPKSSRFELRMKCKWTFRSLHREERTETRLRVPGIRLPGLIVVVDESRIWKDIQETKRSEDTVLWRGVSRFTITGFEIFEMHDFPFDRQMMSLDTFDFVWQSGNSCSDFDYSMHIVAVHVQCVSVLPEWKTYSPIIEPDSVKQPFLHRKLENGLTAPQYASRFSVKLRIERETWFYVIQVFGLTILITIASMLPLCIPPTDSFIGDRLSLYAGGVLTLTSFKYSISDHLPSVPYSTKFDWVIFFQFLNLTLCAVETLIAYRLVDHGSDGISIVDQAIVDKSEDWAFVVLSSSWIVVWILLAGRDMNIPSPFKEREWEYILKHQEYQADNDELEKLESKAEKEQLKKVIQDLEHLNVSIGAMRNGIAEASEKHADISDLSSQLGALQAQRKTKEDTMSKLLEGSKAKTK